MRQKKGTRAHGAPKEIGQRKDPNLVRNGADSLLKETDSLLPFFEFSHEAKRLPNITRTILSWMSPGQIEDVWLSGDQDIRSGGNDAPSFVLFERD